MRHQRKSPRSGQYGFVLTATRRNRLTSPDIRLILLIYKRKQIKDGIRKITIN